MTRGVNIERRQVLGAAAALGLAAVGLRAASAADERVIHVIARKFVFVPDEIAVKQGERVVIELSAPEVIMGFSAPELGLRSDIVPGTPTRLRLNTPRAGRFVFNCDVFCGSGHEDMDGVIVVNP